MLRLYNESGRGRKVYNEKVEMRRVSEEPHRIFANECTNETNFSRDNDPADSLDRPVKYQAVVSIVTLKARRGGWLCFSSA